MSGFLIFLLLLTLCCASFWVGYYLAKHFYTLEKLESQLNKDTKFFYDKKKEGVEND